MEKIPGIKLNAWFQAEVIRKWQKTKWGMNVEYTDLQNLNEIFGNCVICDKDIPLDIEKPMCKSCYYKNKKYLGNIYGKVCHVCGNKSKGILDSKPLCPSCYQEFDWLFEAELLS